MKRRRKSWCETPFGAPSDNLVVGKLAGRSVAFLARHGRGHRLSPSELNFRANIYAMKSLGVERIISLSAVGSLKEEHRPLDFVIPDQFVDRTRGRISTFFGDGLVAHIGFSDPMCPQLAEAVAQACAAAGVTHKKGGSYLCMEGPAFSTRAESNLYRSWGMDVIGMTNLQEAKLAREAEICYATVAMVTDYDCWHPQHDAVTVTDIIANLVKNAENACKVVAEAVAHMPADAHLQVRIGAGARHPHRPQNGAGSDASQTGLDRWQVLRVTSARAAPGLLPARRAVAARIAALARGRRVFRSAVPGSGRGAGGPLRAGALRYVCAAVRGSHRARRERRAGGTLPAGAPTAADYGRAAQHLRALPGDSGRGCSRHQRNPGCSQAAISGHGHLTSSDRARTGSCSRPIHASCICR